MYVSNQLYELVQVAKPGSGTVGSNRPRSFVLRHIILSQDSQPVVAMATTAGVTFALTQDGKLFTWGEDISWLGLEPPAPKSSSASSSNKRISNGPASSAGARLLPKHPTRTNTAPVQRDVNGPSAAKEPIDQDPLPVQIDSIAKQHIVDVACGSCHVLLLNNAGKVFSFGVGEHGALGTVQSNEMILLLTGFDRSWHFHSRPAAPAYNPVDP